MDVRFNAYKAKFDTLDSLTKDIFNSQQIDKVNIFISLDDVYWHCRNSNVNREFQCCGNLASRQLVSNVLNLMAHYREWAVRKNVGVKVFAYYSTSSTIFYNRAFIRNYRKTYSEKSNIDNGDCYYVNSCIKDAADILKTITRYIDSAYVVDTKKFEPAAFPCLCANEFEDMKADWNFVISKDTVEFQYAYYPRFSVIYPKGDETELLNSGNLWRFIADREKIGSSKCKKYASNFFPVALAIVGDKKRDIPKVKGISWRSIFGIMDDVMEKSPDLTPTAYISAFLKECEKRKFDMDQINTNVDVLQPSFNCDTANALTKENIKEQFIDVPDYNNLVDLNKRPDMFAECPINIKFLTRQYAVKAVNPFKLNYS